MKKIVLLIIFSLLFVQFLPASEEKTDTPIKIKLEDCHIIFEDKPGRNISIQKALETCIEFVEKNKIDFNIQSSDVTAWVEHTKNGLAITFLFDYKHRRLSVVVGENKKVISWLIAPVYR